MLDLSIIIPIYNTKNTKLQRCFDSIVFDDKFGYEVILVDDGSKTEVGEFCKAYVASHSEFRYIYKNNGGASSARNMGISVAQGRYVAFVDSDDVFIPSKEIVSLLDGRYDMVICDMLLTVNGHSSRNYVFGDLWGEIATQRFAELLITTDKVNSQCAKYFRREILIKHQIRCDESMISGEDLCFVIDAVINSATIFYVPTPGYHYFMEVDTYIKRTIHDPKRIVDDNRIITEKRLALLYCQEFDDKYTKYIYDRLIEREIEGLFNCAADLVTACHFSEEIPIVIWTRAGELTRDHYLAAKTWIKHQILRKRQWWILGIVAYLRAVYLRVYAGRFD